MPGFDRNGPMGAGPLIGGGRGRCNPATVGTVPPYTICYGRGLGFRRGFRGGLGPGIGAGRRYGRWYGTYPTAAGTIDLIEPADEMEMLKREAEYMKNALEAIKKRIQILEKKPDEKS